MTGENPCKVLMFYSYINFVNLHCYRQIYNHSTIQNAEFLTFYGTPLLCRIFRQEHEFHQCNNVPFIIVP